MPKMNFSPKCARFVEEYAIDHNGAGAAVRAGYAPKSAHVTASRLLRKAKVADAVRALEVEAETELRVTRSRVISELQNAIELARLQNDVSAMQFVALEPDRPVVGRFDCRCPMSRDSPSNCLGVATENGFQSTLSRGTHR